MTQTVTVIRVPKIYMVLHQENIFNAFHVLPVILVQRVQLNLHNAQETVVIAVVTVIARLILVKIIIVAQVQWVAPHAVQTVNAPLVPAIITQRTTNALHVMLV